MSRVDGNIIAVALAHLFPIATRSFQDGRHQNHLFVHTRLTHDLTALLEIQQLINAANFDMSSEMNRIYTHQDPITDFRERHCLFVAHPRSEIFALHSFRQIDLLEDSENFLQGHRIQPLGDSCSFPFCLVYFSIFFTFCPELNGPLPVSLAVGSPTRAVKSPMMKSM